MDILQRYLIGDCSLVEMQHIEQWYKELFNTGEWKEGELEKLKEEMEKNILNTIEAMTKKNEGTE